MRPGKKNQHQTGRPRASAGRDSGRALILVDGEPVRRAAQSTCRTFMRKIEKARAEIRLHQEQSKPEFVRWLHSEFGSELSALRELHQKIQDFEDIITEVQEYRYTCGGTLRQAYLDVMAMRERRRAAVAPAEERDENSESRQGFKEDQGDTRDSGAGYQRTESDADGLRAAFESFFGTRRSWKGSARDYEALFEDFVRDFRAGFGMDSESEEGADEWDGLFGDGARGQVPDRMEEEHVAIREVYRVLVRRLHPDANPDLDRKRKDLWHDVQAAYQERSLDRLEMLKIMSDIYDERVQADGSLWSLKSLASELKSNLRKLQQQTREAKKEPEWDFTATMKNPRRLQALREELALGLQRDRRSMEEAIDESERLIAGWKQPARRRKRSGQASRKSSRSDDWLFESPLDRAKWTKVDMDAFTGFGD